MFEMSDEVTDGGWGWVDEGEVVILTEVSVDCGLQQIVSAWVPGLNAQSARAWVVN